VTVNEFDVIGFKLVGVKVKVKLPVRPVIIKFVNVATPATAAIVVVPDNVPVPEAIEATTLTVEFVTVLPEASVMRTIG